MRIGIDCRDVIDLADGELAGVGFYTFSLVEALVKGYRDDVFVLFVNQRDVHNITDSIARLGEYAHVEIIAVAPNGQVPFWTSHIALARAVELAKCDVFHAPAYVSPLTLSRRVPSVVTIHDLAIYEHPEWFASQTPLSRRVLVPRSLASAKAVIAVSQSTAAQISRVFPTVGEKTHVIYEAAVLPEVAIHEMEEMMQGVREYHRLSPDFFFFVGTIEPRKNLVRVIEGFADAVAALRELGDPRAETVQLVLAGKMGWKYEDVVAAIHVVNKKLTIQDSDHLPEHLIGVDRVKWIDYVSQSEKMALMAHAKALVIASLDEGFGLPALEAMKLGTPVIASSVGALMEITGEKALLVDPYDASAISDAMVTALTQPDAMKDLASTALKHAEQFTWEKTAEETMKLYKTMVKK